MTIFGWDLSHYDAPGIGDAVSEGFSFFTHKAGGDANDAEIGTWWSGVKSLSTSKALLGAYWVLYPGSAGSKADQFLARLDATCPGWRNRPFILQVDCEKWNNDSGTVPSKADIKAFCDRLKARMPKLRPIVYAPEWVYGDKLAGLGYPLWASSYVSGSGKASKLYPGDSSSKWGAYSGQTPAILQFTSSATIAGQTTCDANAYRGTLAQLTALVAPGWDSDMPLTADDLHKLFYTDGLIPAPANSGSVKTNPTWTLRGALQDTGYQLRTVESSLTSLTALVAALSGKLDVGVDSDSAVAGVLAGLTPEQLGAAMTAAGLTPEAITAAIPAEMAQQVVDGLGQRIAASSSSAG
jgi:hypothetical protein